MSRLTDIDWIVEGARVAILTTGHGSASVKVDTIARITAKQIILAQGGKYRRDTLRPVGDATSPWRTTLVELHPMDAPEVVNARAVIRCRNLGQNLEATAKGANDYASALAALDAIARLVAQARASIEALQPSADAASTTETKD